MQNTVTSPTLATEDLGKGKRLWRARLYFYAVACASTFLAHVVLDAIRGGGELTGLTKISRDTIRGH